MPSRLAGLAALSTLFAASAHADWPMSRHDRAHTGTTSDPLAIETPAVTFRHYLGGQLGAREAVTLDVDGDGAAEVVLIAGGKLVAKQTDDTVVWETPPLGLSAIEHITDFNRDGHPELVATGALAFLGVFDGRDGTLLWRLAGGTFGTYVGAVRLFDFNGDQVEDLYAADVGCGSVNGKPRAMAWSFAQGFGPPVDDGSKRLWELPANREYYCGYADVVGDLDADGRPEVIAFGTGRAYAYDGATGAALASGAADDGYPLGFSIPYGGVSGTLADVDGNGARAIVGATDHSYEPAINSRSLWVMRFDRAAAPAERFRVLWRRPVADVVSDRHTFVDLNAADLDADDKAEVFSTFTEGGVTTAYVFDGLTGAVKSAQTGARILGSAVVGQSAAPALLVAVNGELKGYRAATFTAASFGAAAFTLPTPAPAFVFDRARHRAAGSSLRIATLPLTGIGRGLVLNLGSRLELWSTEAPVMKLAAYELPAQVSLSSVAPLANVLGAADGLLAARSDGFLVALNASLSPLNLGGGELGQPGIRTGGYYSGPRGAGHVPIAVRLDRGHDEVLVRNSLGALSRLDAKSASLVVPPQTVWSLPSNYYPLALDLGPQPGRELLVSFEDSVLVGRTAAASEVFRVDTASGGFTAAGLAVPLMRADGGFSFALPQFNASNGEGRAVSVAPQGRLWASTPIVVAGSGMGLVTADDYDQDGDEDLAVMLAASLRLYSGTTGALFGSAAPTYSRLAITVRGRAGPITTVAAASIYGMQGLSVANPPAANTAAAWEVPFAPRFYDVYAAALDCDAGLTIVNPGYDSPELVVVTAETGARRAQVALAQGRLYGSEAEARDAGASPGAVGNVTGVQQLWPGQSAAVMGSTDGYLYALDVCAAAPRLLWSLNLRAPVGETVVGDLDGDGRGELVVTAADGFLYGVGAQRFPAPGEVLDLDTSRPGNVDVDETRAQVLTARWSQVPNATGYEWAVFTAGGTALSRHPTEPGNPFVPVAATVTQASYSDMLRVNARYFFAVRALGPAGASSETLSDGTRFAPADAVDGGSMPPAPDAGSGGTVLSGSNGCRCDSAPGAVLLLALRVVMRRRR